MNIYIITQGTYDDYQICAVTLDKEEAEKLKMIFTTDPEEPAQIETWDTRNNCIWLAGLKFFNVKIRRDGTDGQADVYQPSDYHPELLGVRDFGQWVRVGVLAPDEGTAIKMAKIELEKYLAKKE